MVERRLSAWLRSALALFGIAGILLLAGCGGGSGAPNNPYLPPPPPILPLQLLPSVLSVYPGTPATLTISGGVPPYRAFSTDASILPVAALVSGDTIVLAANPVTAATVVGISVQDSATTVSNTATITVLPAALLASGITITSNPNPACVVGTATLCSGGTGTATVKVTGNGGAGVGGRAVKFDVVQGSFSIVSTNPAQPLVSTLTVYDRQHWQRDRHPFGAGQHANAGRHHPRDRRRFRQPDHRQFRHSADHRRWPDARRPAAREYHHQRTRQHEVLERRHGDQLYFRRYAAVPRRGEFPSIGHAVAHARC